MHDITHDSGHGPGEAFAFTGTWRDYLPIALSNLTLTVVTLGIYRFWAKARERRYLWSHTRFIDDRLEWTGTGRELFFGFLIVMVVFSVPLLALNFLLTAMIARNQQAAAGALFILLYMFLLYLAGFARYRALGYRLSRTYWHGIRGGAEDPGFRYGLSALWKPVVGFLAMGFMIPWSMCSLWNERWRAMSFGPNRFNSDAEFSPLMWRWALVLFSPIIIMIVVGIIAVAVIVSMGVAGSLERFENPNAATMATIVVLIVGFIIGIYALIGILGVGYYAAFFRLCVGHLRLGGLAFEFTARSKHWLLLFLGDVALVVGTLGIGISFLGYRHWSFFIRHMGATGEVDLTQLTQSTARGSREAEGFADAFDMGAI
jgi:uncharacterized membrane protein YjgN (DUF898 family)